MFGHFSESFKKSAKPASALIEMNAKVLSTLSAQQTQFLTGWLSDSKKLIDTVSQQSEVKDVIAAQSVYAESVRERITSASKNTYSTLNSARQEMLTMMQSEAVKAAVTPVAPAKAPAAKSVKSQAKSAAKPAKTSAAKSTKAPAAKATAAKPKAKATASAKTAAASKTTATEATAAKKTAAKKAPVKKETPTTSSAAAKKAAPVKAPPKPQATPSVVAKPKVADLSPSDVKAKK